MAITAYSFDIDEKIDRLIGTALSSDEKQEFKNAHLRHTRSLIMGEGPGSVSSAIGMIDSLTQKQQIPIPHSILSLTSMLDDCEIWNGSGFLCSRGMGLLQKQS